MLNHRRWTMAGNVGVSDFVVFKDVSKKYGTFCALDKVSFSIRQGEIFGYIGPNGAGKTTTMKILVGLLGNFEGEAYVGGFSVGKEKNQVHRLLGYLPQSVAFQDWRTVNQALTTFGKLSNLSTSQVEESIPKTLDLVGLFDVRYKKISQLSGGMVQKVGLAQALLHDPKLLVLDEPLGGLDPLSRHQFKEIVLKLKEKGTTILFSSHILSDVQDVADRVGIISRGKIKQIGSLNDLIVHSSMNNIIEVLLSYVSDKWQEFKSVSGVKGMEQPSPGRILVNIDFEADPDQVIDELIQVIAKLKIRVRSIRLLTPSLDEIYLKYVQESETA
jgi:ABC-2 type transport system ATP-binding protein